MDAISTDIVNVITNVGFPIFLVVVYVFRTEKAINNNTAALSEIKSVIVACQRRK